MNKFKKVLLSFVLVLTLGILLVSCDTVKQIISDVAGPEIEKQVNEMLGLADAKEEDKFALPEATRYENFKIQKSDDGKTTTYAGDVFEPKVEFEDYAKELSDKLGADFTKEDISDLYEEVLSANKWSYVEEDGSSYTFNFKEVVKKDGTVERWTIEVIVYDANYVEETPEVESGK